MPGHQEAIAVMRSNIDFQRHLVSSAVTRVQQIAQQGHCDGLSGGNTDQLIKYCTKIGRYNSIMFLPFSLLFTTTKPVND